MEFKSINPYDGSEVATYTAYSDAEIRDRIKRSQEAFLSWRNVPISERAKLMSNAARVLRDNAEEYATTISREMGKPITESKTEIEKCAWVCEFYAAEGEGFLKDEIIESDAQKSFVRHDPIGSVLAIMPWNFPFWQVFRFAAPTLMAGNTGLLKHAPNVFGCAVQIEEVFTKAGFPKDVFQNLIIHHDKIEEIIAHEAVQAVTLTGSERAGASVAQLAGKYLKKSLLELGGSNAFIVLADADIDEAVEAAVTARMLNSGQSCIAAKRFLLAEDIYEEFVKKFTQGVEALKSGDPLKDTTQVGPLAREDLAKELNRQVTSSVEQGARVLLGGHRKGAYHEPTILTNVRPGMPAFDEETFGPLAALVKVKDAPEALELSERSKFGLGVTIFTKDIASAEAAAARVSDGACFINALVKSDPRLPFGGTKRSGFGRELAKDGIMEFINRKTVYIKS